MLYVAGRRASGKTTVSETLQDRGFAVFDVGPFMRSLIEGGEFESPEEFIENMRATTGNKDWEHDAVAQSVKDLRDNSSPMCLDVVIAGFRKSRDIIALRSRLDCGTNPPSTILFVEASEEQRLNRYMEREGPGASVEAFHRQTKNETRVGVDRVRIMADFVIENNGTIASLESRVKEIVYEELDYELQ